MPQIFDGDTVSAITLATGDWTTIELPDGSVPKSVAFSPDGDQAYVANYLNSTLSVITVSSGAVATLVTLPENTGPGYIDFSPDGEQAYVANFNATVSVIREPVG